MRCLVLAIAVFALTGCAGKESVYAGGGAVKPPDKTAIAATPSAYAGGITAQASEKGATPGAPSPGGAGGPVSYQEFQRFRVEVEDFQIREDGSVLLGFGYVNKTNSAITVSLRGDGTLLSDDVGNTYKLEKELGTNAIIEPGRGSVILIFAVAKKLPTKPRLFNFISRQGICRGGIHCDDYHVVIRGIEAR